MTDREALLALAERVEGALTIIQEGDRPLPWVVHTGCSYRRIASKPTRENLRTFSDGNVLHGLNHRDGHPDLSMGEDQLNALVDMVNAMPEIVAALTERAAIEHDLTAQMEIGHHYVNEAERLREALERFSVALGNVADNDSERWPDSETIEYSGAAEMITWGDLRRARQALGYGQ